MNSKSSTDSANPPAGADSLYLHADDGTLHLAPRRLTIDTAHNTDRYPLGDGIGNVLRVRLFAAEDRPFEILECPATANYIRVFANGQSPHSPAEARRLLQAVRAKFGRALWLRYDGYLYLHPHPVNSGERLVIDYEPIETCPTSPKMIVS